MNNKTLSDENRNQIQNLLDQLYPLKLEPNHESYAAAVVPTIVLTDLSSNDVESLKNGLCLAKQRSVDKQVDDQRIGNDATSIAGSCYTCDTNEKHSENNNTCSKTVFLQVPSTKLKHSGTLAFHVRDKYCSEARPP